jgi:hypothetical protein
MDETLHDRIAERPAAPAEPGDGPPSAEAGIATICAWCPSIHIMKIQRRETDIILAVHQGKRVLIFRNGAELKISDGICPECRGKHFPESVKRKESQP